uniref:Complex 1 LYR protein domain-containing protein n=1 Tax=Phytophthora ramorum TaxID=164328 RepID=H3H015_PHYRM
MKPHSGLQLQVLALYKKALQAAKRKDIDTMRYVRQRFHEDASSVDRKDFVVIEYMLRKGERDLKMLDKMKSAHFAQDPLELAESSVDKLMDASVEDEVDVEKLPELESDSGALELEEANSELLPVESDELLDESRGSELEGSPTEIDPALEDEESRAVALVTVTARRRTEKTFIDDG